MPVFHSISEVIMAVKYAGKVIWEGSTVNALIGEGKRKGKNACFVISLGEGKKMHSLLCTYLK